VPLPPFPTADQWAAAVGKGKAALAGDVDAAHAVCRRRRVALIIAFDHGLLPLQAQLEEAYDLVDAIVVVEGAIATSSGGSRVRIPEQETFAAFAWTPPFARFAAKMRVAQVRPRDDELLRAADLRQGSAPGWQAQFGANVVARWRRGVDEVWRWLREDVATNSNKTSRLTGLPASFLNISIDGGAEVAMFGLPPLAIAVDAATREPSGVDVVTLLTRGTDAINRTLLWELRYRCDGDERGREVERDVAKLLARPAWLPLHLYDTSLRRRMPWGCGNGSSAATHALATTFVGSLAGLSALLPPSASSVAQLVENTGVGAWSDAGLSTALHQYASGGGIACPLCGGPPALNAFYSHYRDDGISSPPWEYYLYAGREESGQTCATMLGRVNPDAAAVAPVATVDASVCAIPLICATAGAIPDLPAAIAWRPYAYEFLLNPLASQIGSR